MASESTATPVIRMMVLETDEPHPDDENEKGTYAELLHRHFEKAGKAHDPPLGIETDQRFVVTEKGGEVPKFEDFDGITGVLITGSMYDAHGDDQWIMDLLDLLRELWTRRPEIHFSGVCFGHQLLSRLLGAKTKPHPDGIWEIGHSRIDLHDIGKKLFRTSDDHIHLNQMHQDRVQSVPTAASSKGLVGDDQEVQIWGHSPHTSIQGLYLLNRLFTTQAHMAFDAKMVEREIQMRIDSGGIKDLEQAKQAADSGELEHDGERVAMAILRFFHYEDDGLD